MSQFFLWYLQGLNNPASRDFLLDPIYSAALDTVIDETMTGPILDQITEDLLPRGLLGVVGQIGNAFKAAHIGLALKVRREWPALLTYVRRGGSVRLMDIIIVENNMLTGVYVAGGLARVCRADQLCMDEINQGFELR